MDIHQVLEVIWTYLVWILNPVEKLTLFLSHQNIPLTFHLLLVVLANEMLILIEFTIIHVFSILPWFRNLKTPFWLKQAVHSKPIMPKHLYILGATPITQKASVFCFHAVRRRVRWKGFFYLSLGGATRVVVYPFLPDVVMEVIIAALIIWGIISFIKNNGQMTFIK